MRLTRATRRPPPHRDDSFPTLQLFILAICRVAEPVALTSIFPYSWLMVKGFHVGDKNDASFYAGILISAFCLAEALSGMWWGSLSDRIGRKPVVLMGCCATVLSLLIVGFSTSFTMALIGRILGGALNGNIGVIQTMVAELVTKPEHEPKAYSVMPFVWSIGTIIGPAVGGTFAKPTRSFPRFFHKGGLFDHFPWLLPNLICAGLMLVSILASYFLLDETHPEMRRDFDTMQYHTIAENTPMVSGATADAGVDLRHESYGTFNEVDLHHDRHWEVNADGSSRPASISEKLPQNWCNWKVSMLVVALGIFTYHSMCYDHLLPIFLQDERASQVTSMATSPFDVPGGLALSTTTVGLIMSVNGIIALFIQAVVFPVVADRMGIWKTFVLVTLLHPLAYFIVPYLSMLPESTLIAGIYTCLTIRNLMSIIAYPVILIMLKQATPAPRFLGKINGLAASVGAGCRTIAPPVVGLLYSCGADLGFTGLAWWGAGAVALIGAVQLCFIPREKRDQATIRPVVPFATSTQDLDADQVVHVSVHQSEEV